jgi:hypothetical protein
MGDYPPFFIMHVVEGPSGLVGGKGTRFIHAMYIKEKMVGLVGMQNLNTK